VESFRDVIAIESTQQYSGLYHVLGGILSPLDGIGPEQLNIDSLRERIVATDVEELIMALSPTIEGDTTVYYIARQVADTSVRITTIARGIAFGGELEYADEMTLARSIAKRLPIDNYVSMRA
jgi:recombination protein RecR